MRSIHLTGNDRFLLITARHRASGRFRPATASYVEFIYKVFGIIFNRLESDKPAFTEFGFVITLKHHVLLKRIIENKPVFMPVFGNMTHTVRIAISDTFMRNIFVVKNYSPAFRFIQTR